MLKTMMGLSALATSFNVAPILINLQNNKTSILQNSQYVNKNILIDNTTNTLAQPLSGEDDLNFDGPNSEYHYRIYIDSTGDKSLPKVTNPWDYLIGYGYKETWYNHLITGLSINTTNYASSKTAFLNKYKAITLSYSYKYNFWNSWDGWSYQYGKYCPLIPGVNTYSLSSQNTTKLIFETRDSSHSNNESAKLTVEQKWEGNYLNFKFYLSVSYYWKGGSTVHHASLAEFKSDNYTFTSIPVENNRNRNAEIVENEFSSNFTLNSRSTEISLTELDNKLKEKSKETTIKNAWFKTANIMVQGYFGAQKVGNTTYIISVMIRWDPRIAFATSDSTLLLNGVDLTRTISTSGLLNGSYRLKYENSFGKEQKTTSHVLPEGINNVEMKGWIFLPFIYVE